MLNGECGDRRGKTFSRETSPCDTLSFGVHDRHKREIRSLAQRDPTARGVRAGIEEGVAARVGVLSWAAEDTPAPVG